MYLLVNQDSSLAVHLQARASIYIVIITSVKFKGVVHLKNECVLFMYLSAKPAKLSALVKA